MAKFGFKAQSSLLVGTVAVLACSGVADIEFSHAGYSGPGGPRFNYDSPPRIEPYTPQDGSASGRDKRPGPDQPTMPEAKPEARPGASQAPRVENLTPVAPNSATHPNQNQSRDDASRQEPDRAGRVPPPGEERDQLVFKSPRQQRRDLLNELTALLAKAESQAQAQRLATSIERIWQQSDSATTELLMLRTDRAIETGRWATADTLANAVVQLDPGYSEGLMRRALINFQRQRTTQALRDLRRVIAIEPSHFIALDRIAAILQSLGESKAALEAYRKLKRIHPFAPGVNDRIEELTRIVEGERI